MVENGIREMRSVYVEALIRLAESDKNIVVLDADLMSANGTIPFRNRFPERTFNAGVAEANMVGIAAGLSATGKIPFAATFACFAARKTYDQFFISGNYSHLNVKLVGTDPGVTASLNGGTHMAFDDIGIMRNIPGLLIIEPCDPVSLEQLVPEIAYHVGCAYLRLHRKAAPVIYEKGKKIELGKGSVVREGKNITLIAAGVLMLTEAMKAAEMLAKEGISAAVLDMHTIKPIDKELVIRYAELTGAIITCENHQICNGLGSAVAEILSESRPTLMKRIGIGDEFGEVGTVEYLQTRYGLTASSIYQNAKKLLDACC